MFLSRSYVSFHEFFTKYYNTASEEPFISRFREESKKGDWESMINILLGLPDMENVKITEKFSGKDDVKAAKLYSQFCDIPKEKKDESDEENKACNVLVEALFAASASSRLFLNALLDCAKISYNAKAFLKCLKYCECMLGLPGSFYDKTVGNADYFLECKRECTRFEHECSRQLKTKSSAIKKRHGSSNTVCSFEKSLVGKHVSTPVVDGKQHRFLESCSDAVALQLDDDKGRHLVATRNIKVGSVLIVDQPFSFSTEEEALTRNCLHCHTTLKLYDSIRVPCRYCQRVSFCSEKCRREASLKYHLYECPILDIFYENNASQHHRKASHLLLAYRTTVAEALCYDKENNDSEDFIGLTISEDFLQYYTESSDIKLQEKNLTESVKISRDKLGINETYSSRHNHTLRQLKTHCRDVEPSLNLINGIDAIFLAKCLIFVLSKMDVICSRDVLLPVAIAMFRHLQAINCNAYEIVENVRDETSHVWEPRCVGGAIYPTVSLTNHSCYPNVVRHSYSCGTVVVRAIRFINKGAEVLDCYGPQFLIDGRLARREYLWKKYRFLCACEACVQNWSLQSAEKINYKCKSCSGPINIDLSKCSKCGEHVNRKKLEQQLRRSVDKRLAATGKMYDGYYEEALPLLLEHIQFIEKILVAPNIETIKTQQCIIQCYNYFGCTSQ